jgi:RecA-family ATPase
MNINADSAMYRAAGLNDDDLKRHPFGDDLDFDTDRGREPDSDPSPYLDSDAQAAPKRVLAARAVCAAALDGKPAQPRGWHVPDLIPANTVTLISGDGGTGKSLLALQLAAATTIGAQWIGSQPRTGGAIYISAEDDADELHRRVVDIAAGQGRPLSDLRRLTLISLAGEDALLAHTGGAGALMPTQLYHELDERMAHERPALVVLDTLVDLFPGNENDRAQARQFIGLLRRLAIRHGAAIVLLSHPSLTGLGSGTGASGSTAWNNSVRSRLYLERKVSEGFEANPDARRLVTKKANYGRTGGEIGLTWREGVFVADAPTSGLDRMAASSKAQRVFLRLLRAWTEDGRFVTAASCSTFAPKCFAEDPRSEGVSKAMLKAAMNELFAANRIVMEEHGSAARRRSRLVEVQA